MTSRAWSAGERPEGSNPESRMGSLRCCSLPMTPRSSSSDLACLASSVPFLSIPFQSGIPASSARANGAKGSCQAWARRARRASLVRASVRRPVQGFLPNAQMSLTAVVGGQRWRVARPACAAASDVTTRGVRTAPRRRRCAIAQMLVSGVSRGWSGYHARRGEVRRSARVDPLEIACLTSPPHRCRRTRPTRKR